MKKSLKKLITKSLAVTVFTLLPYIALAQDNNISTSPFKDPLSGVTIQAMLVNTIKWFLGISAFVAMLAIVLGGIRMILSIGDEKQIQKGKTIITWAVIGLGVILLSFFIINVLATEILVS